MCVVRCCAVCCFSEGINHDTYCNAEEQKANVTRLLEETRIWWYDPATLPDREWYRAIEFVERIEMEREENTQRTGESHTEDDLEPDDYLESEEDFDGDF